MFGILAATAPSPVAAEQNAVLSFVYKLGNLRNSLNVVDRRTWAEMTIKERVFAYDWTLEIFVVATFLVYVAIYIYGRNINKKMVYGFCDAVQPVLFDQFGLIGCTPSRRIVKDSNTRYTTYASGRLNIESLLARFRLKDRQNVLTFTTGLIIPALASADGLGDHIEIDLTPTDPSAIESGVFGVINKEVLDEVPTAHYFTKFTKFVDSDNLPSPTYIFMYEHSDQAVLLTPELKAALSLPGALKVFRKLVYTDLPDTEPKTVPAVSKTCKVHLSLNFPNSTEEYEAARRIVEASLNFVDTLVEKQPYRSSTAKRIKATRDGEVSRIVKAEEAVKREELEAKKAEERREAARRESNLSEKDQRKLKKKEQEKLARKQKQKMTRRS